MSSCGIESYEVNMHELSLKPGVYIISIKAPEISEVHNIIYATTY